jgi:hypothetical protein
MTQAATHFGASLRFRLWVLLAMPIVCAPVFLWIAMNQRVSPETIEDQWIQHAETKFAIEEGDPVGWGDNLLYVASVSQGVASDHRVIWSLKPGNMLRFRVRGNDAWDGTKPVKPGLSTRLSGVLQKLPPSVPPADPGNRVVVAFPASGRWVVRSYPYPGPKEYDDLKNAVFPPDNPPAKPTE